MKTWYIHIFQRVLHTVSDETLNMTKLVQSSSFLCMNVDLEFVMYTVDIYGPIGPTWIYKTVNSVQVCGLIKYAGLWADKVCRFVG